MYSMSWNEKRILIRICGRWACVVWREMEMSIQQKTLATLYNTENGIETFITQKTTQAAKNGFSIFHPHRKKSFDTKMKYFTRSLSALKTRAHPLNIVTQKGKVTMMTTERERHNETINSEKKQKICCKENGNVVRR